VENILPFNNFFDCGYMPYRSSLLAPAHQGGPGKRAVKRLGGGVVDTCLSWEDTGHKIVRWRTDGDFCGDFCVLHFQQAACSTFQTCILNSHYVHIICRSVVDIQSATAEIRRGKKKKEEREKPQGKNIMSASATQGGHNNIQ